MPTLRGFQVVLVCSLLALVACAGTVKPPAGGTDDGVVGATAPASAPVVEVPLPAGCPEGNWVQPDGGGVVPAQPGQQPGQDPHVLAVWASIDACPRPQNDHFWGMDVVRLLEPRAFGVLPKEQEVTISLPKVEIGELTAKLPDAPDQIAVYAVGTYPRTYGDETFVREAKIDHPRCYFVRQYSLGGCGPDDTPTSPKAEIHDEQQAEQLARQALRGLWENDYQLAGVTRLEKGDWRVVYFQHVGGWPVLQDKPLQIMFNEQGQITYVLARRRPLVAVSVYPARSPQEAWQLVKEGHGFALDLLWGAGAPEDGQRFDVKAVELAYVMTHVYAGKEIMQPYYVFRNEKQQALFVPAVAEPHVTWAQKTGMQKP